MGFTPDSLKRSSFRTEFFPSRVVVFCSIIFKARGKKRKKKGINYMLPRSLEKKFNIIFYRKAGMNQGSIPNPAAALTVTCQGK